jgi:hypothetical protein
MKILTNYDFNGNEIQNVKIQNLASPPSSPTKGMIYFNTTLDRAFVFNGAEWIGMDSVGATMTGDNIVTAINGSTAIIDDDNLSANVNDAIDKRHSSHSISDVTGLQTALNGKVDNSRVLTNVPENALFTDTITTINSKTGVITKSDITALGIPGQDTTYNVFTSTEDGLAPKSGGGTTKYLRADGSWAEPPDTKYTLPVAGTSLGGVKSGTDITVDASGNVSVNDDSHNHVISNIDGLQDALDALPTVAEAQGYADTAEGNAKSYTDTAIAGLVDSAPDTLNTLNELAQALGDDPNFATTVTNTLAQKTDKFSATVGDGAATSYVLTHNLNSRDVVVMLRETASPYAQVITDVEMTTTNKITLRFAKAPATNEYTVTIIG